MCQAPLNPRFQMWNRLLGPGSTKKNRQEYAMNFSKLPNEITPIQEDYDMCSKSDCISKDPFNWGDPLDCCTAPVPTTATPHPWEMLKKKEKNNMRNMYNDTVSAPMASVNIQADADFSPEKVAQDHLMTRLHNAKWEKRRELEKTYHLYDFNEPKTIKEMLDRIKAGDYKLDTRTYKEEYILGQEVNEYDSPFRHFDWRKDAVDQAGFDKAVALMEKAEEDVQDTIKVLGSKEGLTAFRAFEAQSFALN